MVRWIEIGPEYAMSRLLNPSHHSIRTNDDEPVGFAQWDRDIAQLTSCIGRHRCHDIADECLVLRPAWGKARRLIRAPSNRVRCLLDFLNLVTVDDLLVPREINHPGADSSKFLTDREEHRITEPTTNEENRFLARSFRRHSRRTHQADWISGLQ